jgi:hypothetical protein
MLQMNLWDKINKIKWIFLVVYGVAQDEHKIEFLSELSAFLLYKQGSYFDRG